MRNRSMKTVLAGALGAALFLGIIIETGAQVIHDPNDPVYRDIDRWAVQGYFSETLPFVRPYPAQVLDRLLDQVIDRGNGEDQARAEAYRRGITAPERSVHAGVRGSVEGLNNGNPAFEGAPFADGIIRLQEWLRASYFFAPYAVTRDMGEENNVPGTWSPYPDMTQDWSSVGSFSIMQLWTSALSVGYADIYFQAGLNRSSFGPFYENSVVLGPQAGRAGHFNLNYRQPRWSYEMLLLEINASDNLGQGMYPNKHLFLHSLNFRPIPSLELSFIESVIWGGRFEFLYILPFVYLFSAQSMGDFLDNSMLGFNVRWAAFQNFQFLFQVYIDDFHFNDIVQLKLNTKYKLAGETGIVWAPRDMPLLSLAADYSLVFPYMYTHKTYPMEDRYGNSSASPPVDASINYINYSHHGRNLGPDLEPNSDRISLRTRWRTLPGMDLSATAYFTRHGNPSAGVDDMDETWHDGSIFDDGIQDHDSFENNYQYLRFLIQDTLDIRLAGGLGLGWSRPVSFGTFSLNADYVLEYGWNRDLRNGNNGFNHYWSLGGGFRW